LLEKKKNHVKKRGERLKMRKIGPTPDAKNNEGRKTSAITFSRLGGGSEV